MKTDRPIIGKIQTVSIEDVPCELADNIRPKLDKNGGNVLDVDKGTPFGDWLESNGFVFTKGWEHIAVFR